MFCTVAALCILTHGDAVTTHVVTVVATSRMERPARPLATVRCASVGHRCMSFISVDRRQFDLPIATPAGFSPRYSAVVTPTYTR